MLKKSLLLFWILVISLWNMTFAIRDIWTNKWLGEILTTDNTAIINPDKNGTENNMILEGTHTAVKSDNYQVDNISNSADKITTQEEAEELTLNYVHRLINWALWMLAFVALIVVLYGWFQMVTAAGDDAKFKSGKAALKKAAIWILWIGLSWLFVSFIFWFVDLISAA